MYIRLQNTHSPHTRRIAYFWCPYLPMKRLVAYLVFLFACHMAQAQSPAATLLAQSPDGKTVKLTWLRMPTLADTAGFDIKRKDGLGDWQQLNRQPLIPSISLHKDLRTAGADEAEVSRISDRLTKLLRRNALQELTAPEFIANCISGDKQVAEMLFLASADYDVAIMCGLAYTDHTVSVKSGYLYGLFSHATGQLLAQTSWNYGEIPDLNVIADITSRAAMAPAGIELLWFVNMQKVRNAHVAGYNVYKNGIRLNDRPVSASAGSHSLAEYAWTDSAGATAQPAQYSISAVSATGIEGTIRPYNFNPADHPDEYKTASVTQIESLGFYFKEGTHVDWTFPESYQRFIKGFLVEKDNIPSGYEIVSDTLAPGTRSYIDNSGSAVDGYIRIRIVTLYNDRSAIPGPDRVYSYFPMLEPPMPQNLHTDLLLPPDKAAIRITWDGPSAGDTLTSAYRIYATHGNEFSYSPIDAKLSAQATGWTFPLPIEKAATYRLFITAISRNGSESLSSDTLLVHVPSLALPQPRLSHSMDGHNVEFAWQYDPVADLAGFRLYAGDNLIADEHSLSPTTREYSIIPLPGAAQSYTIKAVSTGGLLSPASLPEVIEGAVSK